MLRGTKAALGLSAGLLMMTVARTADATASYSISYFAPSGAPPVSVNQSGLTFNYGVYPDHQVVTGSFQITNNSTTSPLSISTPSCTSTTSIWNMLGGNVSLPPLYTTSINISYSGDLLTQNGPPFFISCNFSVTIGGTPFTATMAETATANGTLTAWWNATDAVITNCSSSSFSTTPVDTPISQVFDIGNPSNAQLVISSVSVESNANCFFLLSSPTSPVAPHASSQGRIRLYATSNTECKGFVSLTTSDSTYPYFSFFINGFVGSAPYNDPPLNVTCPGN